MKSVLTSALLALSLGAETVEAAKFGRFGQLARAPLEQATRFIEASRCKPAQANDGFRFLSPKTQRE